MNFKFIIILRHFVFIFFLISCTTKVKNNEPDFFTRKLSFTNDTITIRIDSVSLPFYSIFHSFQENNEEYFLGYNKVYHSLDVFNLSSQKMSVRVPLERQGPNSVGNVEGIFWINQDSIFIYSPKWFSIINDKGKVIEKIQLDSRLEISELITNAYFKMFYNKSKNVIYFFNVFPANKRKEYLREPLVTELNLTSKKLKDLPITFSDYYIQKNGEVGYLAWLNLYGMKNDEIVYNFQYEPTIFTYNVQTKEKKEYKAESKRFLNYARILPINTDTEKWSIHALENTHFFHVLVDPWRSLNYRVNWESISSKKNEGDLNSFMDKPFSLTVMNEDFQTVEEFKLPSNLININTWFVNSEGLLFSPTHPKRENANPDVLEFILYKFNTIEK
jgi:hypothetical protein